MTASFLGIEGLHVFITGAAGGIGSAAVKEFLEQGCKVTAHDLRPSPLPPHPNLLTLTGNISSSSSLSSSIKAAKSHFNLPINILIANAGITDESNNYPIWKIPDELWEKVYNVNIKGTFLTIKHFLLSVEETQHEIGKEIENLAIVVTGSETGKFGQAGHAEYASGKAGLQYGLIRSVKNEIVRLNSKARINAVAPGWVDTPLIEGRLDDPGEMWTEAEATVPLRKIAQPEDVARAMAFLSSHRAAGHVSGECLSIDGGMEGRVVWKRDEVSGQTKAKDEAGNKVVVIEREKTGSSFPATISTPALAKKQRDIRILISIDFDAISGFLGTGASPTNNMADYSSGFFAGQVGVPRLLRLFQKHGIADKVTWFIPGHSIETFPKETKLIVDSGAEIGCHGYAHEGSAQMSNSQELEVIQKSAKLVRELTGGKKNLGWRAPLYQLRAETVEGLVQEGFLYDSSLTHHDSQPYFLPHHGDIKPIDFSPSHSAETWMKPTPPAPPPTSKTLIEIPCNWYMEDMTPLQFLPAAPNSHGYVPPSQIMENWKARFEYLYHNSPAEDESGNGDFIFPLVLHPDTSGLAHVIGMIDKTIGWLKGSGKKGEVRFATFGEVAESWKKERERACEI